MAKSDGTLLELVKDVTEIKALLAKELPAIRQAADSTNTLLIRCLTDVADLQRRASPH